MWTSATTKFLLRAATTFLSAVSLLPGCSSTSTSARWINPDVLSQYATSQAIVRDGWAARIADLPIELHGNLPGQTAMNTAARIKNVLSSDVDTSTDAASNIFSTRPRVVLYIDGAEVPQRRDFCALNKRLRVLPQKNATLTLRGAVCDGQNIVTYARESESLADYEAGNIDAQIAHLKQSLVAALYPAPTSMEIRDLNLAPGV